MLGGKNTRSIQAKGFLGLDLLLGEFSVFHMFWFDF